MLSTCRTEDGLQGCDQLLAATYEERPQKEANSDRKTERDVGIFDGSIIHLVVSINRCIPRTAVLFAHPTGGLGSEIAHIFRDRLGGRFG